MLDTKYIVWPRGGRPFIRMNPEYIRNVNKKHFGKLLQCALKFNM